MFDQEFALERNYYKLKMVDIDNKSTTANVVIIKNMKGQQGLVVINNPFTDHIDIRFNKMPLSKIRLQLTDASGRLIHKEETSTLSQYLRYELAGKALAKGVYILSADVDGSRYNVPLLKQ